MTIEDRIRNENLRTELAGCRHLREAQGTEIERLKAENAGLVRDRQRASSFVASEAWDAMNERRAALIGVAHPLPPVDDAWKDRVIELLTAERDKYQVELATLRGEVVEASQACHTWTAWDRLNAIAERIRGATS